MCRGLDLTGYRGAPIASWRLEGLRMFSFPTTSIESHCLEDTSGRAGLAARLSRKGSLHIPRWHNDPLPVRASSDAARHTGSRLQADRSRVRRSVIARESIRATMRAE